LSFTLPPDSGEKLTLGVTILLSMIVMTNRYSINYQLIIEFIQYYRCF
jgi:hypothetical protein